MMKLTGETRQSILNNYTMEDVVVITEIVEYDNWGDEQRMQK
jgi:hypothetical protein